MIDLPIVKFNDVGTPDNLVQIIEESEDKWKSHQHGYYYRETHAFVKKDNALNNFGVKMFWGPVKVKRWQGNLFSQIEIKQIESSFTFAAGSAILSVDFDPQIVQFFREAKKKERVWVK